MALNSLAKQGRFSEVLSLLEAMESASIKPTEVTFGTAINGAARANNSAAAVALLGRRSGCVSSASARYLRLMSAGAASTGSPMTPVSRSDANERRRDGCVAGPKRLGTAVAGAARGPKRLGTARNIRITTIAAWTSRH